MTDEKALKIYAEYFNDPHGGDYDDENRREIVEDIRGMITAETLDDAVESVRYWGCSEQVRGDIARMRAKYDAAGNVRTRATVDVPIDVTIVPDGEGYAVTVPALPGVATQGDTFEAALENAREAIRRHLDGKAWPGDETDEQVAEALERLS